MSVQQILTFKSLKLGIMMLAAAFMVLAPFAHSSAAANNKVSITARVLDDSQDNKTNTYRYGPNKPKEVKPGEWFKIQFTLKNNSNAQLKNVRVDWKPSQLTFQPSSGNGETAKAKSYAISLDKLNKNASREYTVRAKFDADARNGAKLSNMPIVTARSGSSNVKDQVNSINVVVKTTNAANPNNKQDIWLTARVLDYAQNPKTDAYKYNEQNPKKVKPGEWFQIQFKLKNTSGKQLKNLNMSWAPKNLLFPAGGKGDNRAAGVTVTPQRYTIKFTPFNKGGERIYTVMVKFKGTAQNGETINAQNKGNMPTTTANLDGKQVRDTVRTINAMVQIPPVTPGSPLEIAKTTDTPSPVLNAPFNYLVSVKNTSDVAQKVTFNDINTAPNVQNFTAVSVEGATESTLKIASGEEAVRLAEELAKKLAAEVASLPSQTEVQKTLKALKQSQYAMNKDAIAVNKAKLALNQAKTAAAKKKAQATLKAAQQRLTKAKQATQAAWKAYNAALKTTGETPAPGSNPADEANQPKDGSNVPQTVNGTFNLAAGATATVKLSAVIVDDSEAANAILNSAVASVEGAKEVKSNETSLSLCRTTECGAQSEIIEAKPIVQSAGVAPASIPSTGPGAVAVGIVGISALGYGARQWMASRRAMHDALDNLYKPDTKK